MVQMDNKTYVVTRIIGHACSLAMFAAGYVINLI